jgi:protein O-GlcNAc transferase
MPRKRKPKKQKLGTRRVEAAIDSALQCHQGGHIDKAEAIYRKILKTHPHQPDALHFLGLIAGQMGNMAEAETLLEKASRILPRNAVYHHNLGTFLKGQGRWEEAIRRYREAVRLQPSYAEAHYNMGEAYLNQGNPPQAILCFQKTVELRPDFTEAYNSMGNAFQDLGKLEEAIGAYRKALQLESVYPEAFCQLLFLFHETCSWAESKNLRKELDDLINQFPVMRTEDFESPFVSVATCPQPERNLSIARIWSSNISEEISHAKLASFSVEDRKPKEKITVGYLSGDFHDHATAHLMLGLFGLHDRREFEIHCYSYGKDDGSRYRQGIRAGCDRFIDVSGIGDYQVARHIHEAQVDILVELKGYTTGGRMQIPAFRPAPVQVSYLGFPGTSGADFFDYIITDDIVTPESQSPYYTEKFVYLPHCYQVNDHGQTITQKELTRSRFGLPEYSFVFCSFNQGYKIDPVMFGVWMKILTAVPKSVLWLLVKSKTARSNLKREARLRGVNPDRLCFAERLSKPDHLARLGLADLALDTRIYNGHTTSSDALWAGVPVITLQGTHFASRVSSSILTAIGLPELITSRLEEYEQLAVKLASDPGELQALREKLAEKRLVEPLFDTPLFAKNLERAYKEMWKIFVAGEEPRQISVGGR